MQQVFCFSISVETLATTMLLTHDAQVHTEVDTDSKKMLSTGYTRYGSSAAWATVWKFSGCMKAGFLRRVFVSTAWHITQRLRSLRTSAFSWAMRAQTVVQAPKFQTSLLFWSGKQTIRAKYHSRTLTWRFASRRMICTITGMIRALMLLIRSSKLLCCLI